jgi:tetratricopeptide (TPR) repeat protein
VRVQAEQPTGDDARDLEEILALFREKVAQKIDPKDAASHYDLGLAFKEMGLYGDAIAQLQAALRAGASPLATLEVLGECFIESGDPELAARILDRATQLQSAREEDLVGVRHWLARAREALDFDNPTGAA